MDRANFLRGSYPDLVFPFPSPYDLGDGSLSGAGVRRRHQNACSGSGPVRAHVWELAESISPTAVHVVFLFHGSLLPWCIRKPALDVLANLLLKRHRARLLAFNSDQCPGGALRSFDQFLDAFCELFHDLDLKGPVILVCGAALVVPVIWRLKAHLAGAVVLNFMSHRPAEVAAGPSAAVLRNSLYREAFAGTADDIVRIEQDLSI